MALIDSVFSFETNQLRSKVSDVNFSLKNISCIIHPKHNQHHPHPTKNRQVSGSLKFEMNNNTNRTSRAIN